jgi:hypothetical protein
MVPNDFELERLLMGIAVLMAPQLYYLKGFW